MEVAEGRPFLGPWPPTERAALGFAALLTFLLLTAYDRAFAMIFVLNFSTEGPNATVLLVVLFATGLLYVLGLHRHWPHPRRLMDASAFATAICALASLAPDPTLGALFAIGVHVAATPLVFTLLSILRSRMAVAATIGVLVHQLTRELLNGLPTYANLNGGMVLGVLVVMLLVWWYRLRHRIPVPTAPLPARPHLLYAFLILEYVFLGSAVAVSTWHDAHAFPITFAGPIGLLVGLIATDRLPRDDANRSTVLWTGAGTLGAALLVLLFLPGNAPWVALFFGQAAAVVVLDRGLDASRTIPLRSVGARLAGFQILGVTLVFLHVAAGNWAFVAGAGPLVRGHAGTFLLVLSLLLPIAALLPQRRPREVPA